VVASHSYPTFFSIPPLPFRIVLSTIQFGAVGTVASTVAFGPEVSLPFLAGSLSGALYLYLLGKKTDSIGAGERRYHGMIDHTMTQQQQQVQ
jgi:hypothetical protein